MTDSTERADRPQEATVDSDRELVIDALHNAVARLRIFCDPTDERCSVHGIAREESRIYLSSWVIPAIELALSAIGGAVGDEEMRELRAVARDSVGPPRPSEKAVTSPFSRLRYLDDAERVHRLLSQIEREISEYRKSVRS